MKRSRRRVSGRLFLVCLALAAVALVPSGATAEGEGGGDGTVSVIEVRLPSMEEFARLSESAVDLTHELEFEGSQVIAQVVVDETEAEVLRAQGFQLGATVSTTADGDAVIAERDETIAALKAEAEEDTPDTGVKVLRADYITSVTTAGNPTQAINVEAKPASGSTANMIVRWDSGPGTPMGSGGQANLGAFIELGVYLYHRGQFTVQQRPSKIEVRTAPAPNGLVGTADVTDWLSPDPLERDNPYFKDFVSGYMTPTDLDLRIRQLAAEFPDLAEVVDLPNKTHGYRRKAQAQVGATNNAAAQASALYVTSKSWGHEGGNQQSIEMRDPGVANSPLSVSVDGGNAVVVSLATGATGAPVSTAAQVVAAINDTPASAALMTAYTYRGNAGNGVRAALAPILLSDFLTGNYSHEPWTVRMLRIGKHRDGSRPGVLGYAQEHAREIVTPLVTIETAERLLRNYALDGRTKQLLNNLEIFLIPSVNPDGSHLIFGGFNDQRRNMVNHCPAHENDPARRNVWGVDVNRNYKVGSAFDGWIGNVTATDCRSGVFAGAGILSENESKNVTWVADTFDNIKFAMNIHSSGNYFMWSPGSYGPGRVTLPRPSLGDELFFWASSNHILSRIKEHRGLSVTPRQTGPIADVLYSAPGNSGDMLWYDYGIYAWNFEVGGAGFQPVFNNEGHTQALEFANGLVALAEVAYQWSKDGQPPKADLLPGQGKYAGPVSLRWETSEPATVFYTLDGSTPTAGSSQYSTAGVRELGERIPLESTATVKWFAVDAAGNQSPVKAAKLTIGG
jgi:Zinc carboxypeptidase/Chitobiase/beta-hexosaminidase C-terminal domain